MTSTSTLSRDPVLDYAAALEAFEERLDDSWDQELGAAIDDPCVRARYATLERRRLRLHSWLAALDPRRRAVPARQLEGLWSDVRSAWVALQSTLTTVGGERARARTRLRARPLATSAP